MKCPQPRNLNRSDLNWEELSADLLVECNPLVHSDQLNKQQVTIYLLARQSYRCAPCWHEMRCGLYNCEAYHKIVKLPREYMSPLWNYLWWYRFACNSALPCAIIYMQTKQRLVNISTGQHALGKEMCMCLPHCQSQGLGCSPHCKSSEAL